MCLKPSDKDGTIAKLGAKIGGCRSLVRGSQSQSGIIVGASDFYNCRYNLLSKHTRMI